ncbi:MAG TPA: SGNH/GDSL hydrolase family protein [Candidatus Binatia bacterium]|nr:SGNH/GDSL hydrolase family protein [Candidatus Binatia bacterium]
MIYGRQFTYLMTCASTASRVIALALLAACSTGHPLTDRNGDGVVSLVCLGDSNTAAGGPTPSWCDLLRTDLPAWQITNSGAGFSTATDARRGVQPWFNSRNQLATVLGGKAPDGVVLAYGTNDVMQHKPVAEIVAAYRARCAEAAAANVRCWVALTPPFGGTWASYEPAVEELNAALRAVFPPETLIDFFAGIAYPDDYGVDGIHLGERGQRKRLVVARRALAGW